MSVNDDVFCQPHYYKSGEGSLTHPNFGSPSEAPSKSLRAAKEDKEISITSKTT